MSRFLTRDEAAEALGVSVRTIATYIARGTLKAEKRPWWGLRDRVYIRAVEVQALKRRRAS